MSVATLIGVYDADGTLTGEITYLFEKLTGRGHCSLCDITHGWLGRRRRFTSCTSEIAVPFELFHRNDQPHDIRAMSVGRTPLVAARLTDGSVHEILGPAELSSCTGSPEKLFAAIDGALAARGWTIR